MFSNCPSTVDIVEVRSGKGALLLRVRQLPCLPRAWPVPREAQSATKLLCRLVFLPGLKVMVTGQLKWSV